MTGPGGERWEVYTVLAGSPTFGTSVQTVVDAGQAPDRASAVEPRPARRRMAPQPLASDVACEVRRRAWRRQGSPAAAPFTLTRRRSSPA